MLVTVKVLRDKRGYKSLSKQNPRIVQFLNNHRFTKDGKAIPVKKARNYKRITKGMRTYLDTHRFDYSKNGVNPRPIVKITKKKPVIKVSKVPLQFFSVYFWGGKELKEPTGYSIEVNGSHYNRFRQPVVLEARMKKEALDYIYTKANPKYSDFIDIMRKDEKFREWYDTIESAVQAFQVRYNRTGNEASLDELFESSIDAIDGKVNVRKLTLTFPEDVGEVGNIDIRRDLRIKHISCIGNTVNTEYQSEYIKNNFKEDCCLYTLVIDNLGECLKKYELKKAKKLQAYHKKKGRDYDIKEYQLTYEDLEQYKDEGKMTLNGLKPFLEEKRLSVKVFDEFNKLIWSHISKNDDNMRGQTLYLTYKDNHVQFNQNSNSLSHISMEKLKNSQVEKPSSIYKMPQKETKEEDIVFASNDTELEKIVSDFNKKPRGRNDKIKEDNKDILCFYDGDLKYFVFSKAMEGYHYQTNWSRTGCCLTMRHYNDYRQLTIECDTPAQHIGKQISDNDEYREYLIAKKQIQRSFIQGNYQSYYPEDMKFMVKYNTRNAVKGFFEETKRNEFYELDVSKNYAGLVYEMEFCPVFTTFNALESYDGQINNHYLYTIELLYKPKGIDQIFFNQKYQDVYGFELNQTDFVEGKHYKILAQRAYTYLVPSDMANGVEKVMTNEKLNLTLRKFLVNYATGLLEKKFNSISQCAFDITLADSMRRRDGFSDDLYKNSIPVDLDEKTKGFWVTVIANQTDLDNGYFPIKQQIYSMNRVKMYKLAQKYQQYHPVGIQTDALYFLDEPVLDECDKMTGNVLKDLGKIKPIKSVEMSLNQMDFYENENYLTEFEEFKPNIIKVANEFNITEEIPNKCIFQASEAGSGKTRCCKKLSQGKRVMFICPQNKQVNELNRELENGEAFTVDRVFGLDRAQNETNRRMKLDDYDVIVFDELCLYTFTKLQLVYRLMKDNPDKIYYANGDMYQLPAIESDLNKDINKDFLRKVINGLFPNQVHLEIPKRFTKSKDQNRAKLFRQGLFKDGKPRSREEINSFLTKTFKMTNEVKPSNLNIVAYNATRHMVNAKCQKQLKNTTEISMGDKVIMKKFIEKGDIWAKNEIYTVMYINKNKNEVMLQNIDKNQDTLSIKQFEECFELAHAYTGYSLQGSTMEQEKTVIFDWWTGLASAYWLNVALTRSRNLDNIYLSNFRVRNGCLNADYQAEDEVHIKANSLVKGYQQTDAEQGLKSDITADWIIQKCEECSFRCSKCSNLMDTTGNTAFSVNRKNNRLNHLQSNCEVICCRCNKSLKDRQ